MCSLYMLKIQVCALFYVKFIINVWSTCRKRVDSRLREIYMYIKQLICRIMMDITTAGNQVFEEKRSSLLKVKENNMRKYCRCAGDFTNTVSATDLSKTLTTFSGIAR